MGTREPTGAATPRAQPVDGFGWRNGLLSTSRPSVLSEEQLVSMSSAEFQALQHFSTIVEAWWNQFQVAFIEYGPGAADETGLAGQWGDLHRKVKKLKRFMWEGESDDYLTRETPSEILRDLIGHCFLALEMMSREMPSGRSSASSVRPFSSAPVSSQSARDLLLVCRDEDCARYGRPISSQHQHRFRPGKESCP